MRFIYSFVLSIALFSVTLFAFPSGGPYGPLHIKYELPRVSGKIYYVAPDGKSENSGATIAEPTTIESAIAKVSTGDAIILRGGVYRTGNLVLNQGVTIQPYGNEQPVFKGTKAVSNWQNLGNGLWKTSWESLFPAAPDSWWSFDRYGRRTPLCMFNNDMVFVDGRFLNAVSWPGAVTDSTYYIDYATKQVYIGSNPAGHLVEITAYDVAILRTIKDVNGKTNDHKGFTLRGITFTQYAYRAIEIEGHEPEKLESEAEHGKDVVGTTIDNCTLTYCSRAAAYLRGDHLTIRHCHVSETSTEGIYIIGSSDVLLEKNIFEKNNIEHFAGYYPAAVKIFNQSYRVTCRDNLIYNLPFSNGIWYDVGEVDGVFVDNWVEGVGNRKRFFNPDQPYPSENGFFFEISKGVTCAGNVFVNCDQGIFILNSSNAHVYNNTFVNSTATFGRNGRTPQTDRLFGWHSSTGPSVQDRKGHVFVNNLLYGDSTYHRPLLFVEQPADLCGELSTPSMKEIDNNVYVDRNPNDTIPAILWSPAKNEKCRAAYASPADLNRAYPEFATKSMLIKDDVNVFKGEQIGNYEVESGFIGEKAATKVPKEIGKLMGTKGAFVGAYPTEKP